MPKPDPVDRSVGERVRRRRVELSLSQDALATAIGVSFQQVQKYERGVNRISASRLCALAEFLRVEPTYFFGAEASSEVSAHPSDIMADVLATEDGMRLAAAFHRIGDGKIRRLLVALVQGLADQQDDTP